MHKKDHTMAAAHDSRRKSDDGLWETVKVIIQALLIAFFVRTFFYQPFNIPSASMYPTLRVGDYLFVSKLSYGYGKYSFNFSLGGFGREFVSCCPIDFPGRVVLADTPTWGGMIAEGRQIIYQAWWVLVFPLLSLFLTVLGLGYVPTAAAWGMAYVIGPGVALGAGASVTLWQSSPGRLPAFPLLAMLPAQAPRLGWVLLAVPVAAGVFVKSFFCKMTAQTVVNLPGDELGVFSQGRCHVLNQCFGTRPIDFAIEANRPASPCMTQ